MKILSKKKFSEKVKSEENLKSLLAWGWTPCYNRKKSRWYLRKRIDGKLYAKIVPRGFEQLRESLRRAQDRY